MKIRRAKESGICPIREELYNECFEEIIRTSHNKLFTKRRFIK
jgi:hypothetical protein